MELKQQPIGLDGRPATGLPLASNAQRSGAVEDACEKFEAIFAQQLIQSLSATLESGSLFGDSAAGDVYSGLVEWELAQRIAERGQLGIKQLLLKHVNERTEHTS